MADRNPYSNTILTGRRHTYGLAKGADYGGWGLYGYTRNRSAADVLGFSPPPTSGSATAAQPSLDPASLAAYADQLRKGRAANSRNHKQQGQNVAYLDGHVKWANHSKVGVDDDSIWSNWAPAAPSDGIDFVVCGDGLPCDAEPPAGEAYGQMRSKLRWQTDAVLLP
jgi:prepilin-type processing-associated H-X9-DG protein